MIDKDEETIGKILHSITSRRGQGRERVNCPDEEKLAVYIWGALPETPKNDLEAHLADCSACASDLSAAYLAARENDVAVVPQDGVRLTLLAGSRELASYLARQGKAIFDGIPTGEYRLAVSQDGRPMGSMRLEIKEGHHGR